jgi:hypothetical protein
LDRQRHKYPIDTEARAIEWRAGREMESSSMFDAAAREERRLARPLRMQRMPWRDRIIEGRGAIVWE